MKVRSFIRTALLGGACLGAGTLLLSVSQGNIASHRSGSKEVSRSVTANASETDDDPSGYSLAIRWAGEAFEGIIDRPVFSPSRRPAPPPPPTPSRATPSASMPPSPPQPPPLALDLVGIATDPERRVALLRSRQSGLILVLAEGEAVEGWILRRVSSDRAEFHYGLSEAIVTFPASEAKQKAPSPRPLAGQAPWSTARQ